MRKQQHVAVRVGTKSLDHTIGPSDNLGHGFAAGAPVAEQIPVGGFLADIGRPASLVPAIIHLGKIGVDFRPIAEPGQLAGPPCALQGTGQHALKHDPVEPTAELLGVPFTARRKRNT